MRILLTGGSSFTGMWFAKELALAGHDVVIPLLRPREEYSGRRLERVEQLLPIASCHFGIPFGSPPFLQLIQNGGPWDIFCHHAADVTEYKSPDFDVLTALKKNTHNLNKILLLLKEKGCKRLILTGTVFEQSDGKEAVSPYGLSKGLTRDYVRHFSQASGLLFSHFIIPNPFGPFEEPRFTQYLIEAWSKGERGKIQFPDYIRDNIHVSLLAKAYRAFVEDDHEPSAPSGYIETQGAFAKRFATAMEMRLQIPCPLEISEQLVFSEPLKRVNSDPLNTKKLDWSEKRAWDGLASYYKRVFLKR